MRWRKSKHSNPNGACVEVGEGSGILVRDTTDREGPVLNFTPNVFAKFTDQIKRG